MPKFSLTILVGIYILFRYLIMAFKVGSFPISESEFRNLEMSRFSTTFFYPLFGCPAANFGPLLGGSLTDPMFITAFYLILPEGHREPLNKVGSQSPAGAKISLSGI